MRRSAVLALLLCFAALPAAAMILVDSGGVTATIIPGHTAVVFYAGYQLDPGTSLDVFKRGAAIVADSDGDGVIRLNSQSFPVRSTVLVFDLQQQSYEIVPGTDGTVDLSPLQVDPIAEHGPSGSLSYLSLLNPGLFEGGAGGVCLIRPGNGAWVQTTLDGTADDADGVRNDRATVAVSSMQAAAGGPAAPAQVQNGDWVFYAVPGKGYALQKLALPYAASAGRLVAFADPATEVEGKSIRVWISREMGSDGSLSCAYVTQAVFGDDARFQNVSGTLTFGPGETLKSFDIPTVNDSTYSGRAEVEVDLSGSEALDTSTVFLSFADDEPLPSVSVANVSIPDDGSNSGVVAMTIALTGSTTLPASVDVSTSQADLGTFTFAPGETSKSVVVPWTRAQIVNAFPAAITLSSPDNCTISRANAYVTFRPNGPQLTLAPGSMPEGNSGTTNAAIPVTLSPASSQTVTVSYATSDGTAKAGIDYLAVSGTLQFAPGETSKVVNVPVLGNLVQQHDRTFNLNLSNANGAALAVASTTFTIVEDDVATLSTSDVSVTEGNSGTTTATVTVTLSCASSDPVTVSYATSDLTAFAGEDYAATSGTLRFDPGVVKLTIAIPILPNTTPQQNRAFRLSLVAPSGATAGLLDATVTILDDDAGPSAVLTPSDLSVLEGGAGITNAAVDVALSQALPRTVTVSYATADVSALDGIDYIAAAGTLTIPAGETHKSLSVTIIGNNVQETNRYFVVNFSHPAGATITRRTSSVTIVDDDVAALTIADAVIAQTSSVTHATLDVKLSSPSATTTNVSYATIDGSAAAGRDYVAASGQLAFAPGETQKSIPIDILGDAIAHAPRTFTVVLRDANVAVARGTATVTIVNGVLPHHRAAGH